MPNYRRALIPGTTYFFTVNRQDRRSDLLIREVELLRETIRATRAHHPFHIGAWVMLPDHMHCLWKLPPGDTDFALRWKVIKFDRSHAPRGNAALDALRRSLPSTTLQLISATGQSWTRSVRKGVTT